MAFEEFPEYPSLADAIEAADKVTVRWDGYNRIRHLSAAQVAAIVSALRAPRSETTAWLPVDMGEHAKPGVFGNQVQVQRQQDGQWFYMNLPPLPKSGLGERNGKV